MNTLPRWLLTVVLVLTATSLTPLTPLTSLSAAESTWQTGAAKVAITPEKPMWMAGYASRDHAAEGKSTELWAKALVLDDGQGHRAVMITLDLVGIGGDLSRQICQSLEKDYGLQRHQIALCASHTHSGPVVKRNLAPLHYLLADKNQQALIDEYANTLRQRIVAVVGEALERLAPSNLFTGSGSADFAVNRRENREADVPSRRAAGELQGPVDHDVPVLAVRDPEGNLKTVLFGYACHATVLGLYDWSGDYPGFAQMALEAQHPECIAMFFAGCGGDQNPVPRRKVELAGHYGRRLASAVESVLLTTQMEPVTGGLQTSYREIHLPLAPLPTRTDLERDAQESNKYVAARARMLLEHLDAGHTLRPDYPYPIAVWQIGDGVDLVILGGEVVVDYAIRLKAELSGSRTWVAAYANDVMAYIASRRVLNEGGYEGGGAMVYYGLPTVWAPEIENDIVAAVHAQLDTQP